MDGVRWADACGDVDFKVCSLDTFCLLCLSVVRVITVIGMEA